MSPANPNHSPAPRRYWKYFGIIASVACFATLANALRDWLVYSPLHQQTVERSVAESARVAAADIAQYVSSIEGQARWTLLPLADGTIDENRLAALRFFREQPAVRRIVRIDANGSEQLELSQTAPDVVRSGRLRSQGDWSVQAGTDAVLRVFANLPTENSPRVQDDADQLYLRIALSGQSVEFGVTIIDVNLRLLWDTVRAIKIGQKGFGRLIYGGEGANRGQIIGSPVMAEVLNYDNIRSASYGEAALRALRRSDPSSPTDDSMARNFGSLGLFDAKPGPVARHKVLAAYAQVPVNGLNWLVTVEYPRDEALAQSDAAFWSTIALLAATLAAAALASVWLARHMAGPIELISMGAEQIGSGNYRHRIVLSTGDELDALALEFNRMAERVERAHVEIEETVDQRTRELAEVVADLRALNDVSDEVNATLDDMGRVLEIILTKAVELSGSDAGSIYEFDEPSQHFRFRKNQGMDEALIKEMEDRGIDNASITAEAARKRKTIQVQDLTKEAPRPVTEIVRNAGFNALLVVPIFRGERTFGALTVRRRAAGAFPSGTVEFLETLAAQCALALQNARLFREAKEQRLHKERMLEVIEKLLPPDVVDVLKTNGLDGLKPERRDVTLVFVDLRNYTAVAREQEPERIWDALHEYHHALVPLSRQYGGMVERFVGDAILVIFNAPLRCDDPAGRAVRFAIAARDAALELAQRWRDDGYQLGAGISIDQDHATCGLMGTDGRYDYVANGTVTNRASRICGTAAAGQILTTRRVASQVGKLARIEYLGSREFKGFRELIEIFEVIELLPDPRPPDLPLTGATGGAADLPDYGKSSDAACANSGEGAP